MAEIKRPKVVKVFGSKAQQGDYLPVKFATNTVVAKEDYEKIANANFEYGLESLEKDLQLKDLNSVLYYQSALLGYLFEQGIPEFSAFENYPVGSVVKNGGAVWIAKKNIKATNTEKSNSGCCNGQCDPCNPQSSVVCGTAVEPNKEDWCKFITSCEYDQEIKDLKATDQALQESIDNLKGVEGFTIDEAIKELKLSLSDGSVVKIPMTKFGHITENSDGTITIKNADGTVLTLPKYVAEADLDQNKGFYFNAQSRKWEVDLADLLADGSGLEVDRNGKVKISPEYTRTRTAEVSNALANGKAYTDTKVQGLKDELSTNGTKVFVGSGLSGDGTKTQPIDLKLGDGLALDSNGRIFTTGTTLTPMTNFNTHNYRYGMSVFNGYSATTIGLPEDISSDQHEQGMRTTPVTTGIYDFNGYYIASPDQLDVYLSGVEETQWKIVNDHGVNPDGSLKNPNGWGQWQKLDNASSLTNVQVQSIQGQLNSLGSQLQVANQANQAQSQAIDGLRQQLNALNARLDEQCTVAVKYLGLDVDYTLATTDNVLTVDGGVINIPTGLPVGRSFTIIQTGTKETRFQEANGIMLHVPKNTGKKIKEQNGAVSVLIDLNNNVRLLGALKA